MSTTAIIAPSGDETYEERLARERDFHNERFATDNREAQDKYYIAIRACGEAMDDLVRVSSQGRDVLEYGCATGGQSLKVAPAARTVHGIDISDVAVEKARATAAELGIANVAFSVEDAMATKFGDDRFDVIFGSGIIHHLDTEASIREIYRLLRPGGVGIFKEPLGHNILIEAYRRTTPEARTEDEHPLLRKDLEVMRAAFPEARFRFFGLLTLLCVPLRRYKLAGPVYRALSALDDMLFRVPALKYQAWYVLIELRKSVVFS